MKFEIHRSLGVNLKIFLDMLGYKSVWNQVNSNFDELVIFPDDRVQLIQSIIDEVNKTGFIPYHFLVSPSKKGEHDKAEKYEFTAPLTQSVELKNVSGGFYLYLFEGDNNYLMKTYQPKEIGTEPMLVKGKSVAKLVGKEGEILNLFNYGRVYMVETNDGSDEGKQTQECKDS